VILERFENNNVDTAGYGADGSRRGE